MAKQKVSPQQNRTDKLLVGINLHSTLKEIPKVCKTAMLMLANPVGVDEFELLDGAHVKSGRNYPTNWGRELGIEVRRYCVTTRNGQRFIRHVKGQPYSDELLASAWLKYACAGVRGGEGWFYVYSLACYEDAVRLAAGADLKLARLGMRIDTAWLTQVLARYPAKEPEAACA